jgi:hypothetical protein
MTTNVSLLMHGRRRSGISLLEVLISIGILSVGLLATLALIPAGRSIIRKAEIENRAAAVIPNAFATMSAFGLFRVDAMDWQSNPREEDPPADRDDGELPGLRPPGWVAPGPEAFDPANPPSGKDTHFIKERWTTPDPPPVLSGAAPAGETVQLRKNGAFLGAVPVPTTGQWSFTVTPALPSPNMEVTAASPWKPVTPYDTYKFEAYWEEEKPDPDDKDKTIIVKHDVPVTVTPDPLAAPRLAGDSTAAAYRHYHLRRRQDYEAGKTNVNLSVNPDQRGNEEASSARKLEFPTLGETVFERRLAYVYRSRIRLKGEVWRWQQGTRSARWDRWLDYANRNECNSDPPTMFPTSHVRYYDSPPNLIPYIYGYFPGPDGDGNYGTKWLDSNGVEKNPQGPNGEPAEDADWYRIDVEAGQTIEIDWSLTPIDYLARSFKPHSDTLFPKDVYRFPLYFKASGEDDAALLTPAGTPADNKAVYAMPGDGYVLTRVRLQPAKLDENFNVDRRPGIQTPGDDDYPYRINTVFPPPTAAPDPLYPNPHYSIDMTLYRNDRVVAIDPMMCTRLDRILLDFPGSNAHSIKRRRFADFQQTFVGTNTPKSFVIPRLNWSLAATANFDQAIGLADFLCRPQDTLQVDLSQKRRDGPSLPTFDTVNGQRVRRRYTDRMSWLLMLQPEDAGSVPANWKAGKYFHASIVVFEDRLLPATTDSPPAPVEGEYAFVGEWSFGDGRIKTVIPKTLGIADEDIQKMFRTGAWVLLAPRQALPDAPIDDDTLLQWVEIQTAEIQRLPDSTEVSFLPAEEPDRTRLLQASPRAALAARSPVVVLAYQGVVNVVTRAARIQE